MKLEHQLTPPEPGDEQNWQEFMDEVSGHRSWVPKAAYEVFREEQERAFGLLPPTNEAEQEQERHK